MENTKISIKVKNFGTMTAELYPDKAPKTVENFVKLAKEGFFNGLIVASMMGCTVSFTIPYALQVADKKHHADILFGILCGIVTIPVGCVVAGFMLGFSIKDILLI